MERFEAVVVGAGPAGAAAALELARSGVQTLVLERGKFAGQKNATGGILYGQTNTRYNLDYLIPDFHSRAPLERAITTYKMHAVAGDKVKTLDLEALHDHNTKWSYSVLRAKFDRWLAAEVHKECKKTGGGLLTDVRATGPLMEDGKIVGVITDSLDPIKADLVIAADGATSELVRQAGLRGWGSEEKWFQGVKVVVKFPEAALNERFGLRSDEGAAHLVAGDIFGRARGGGFLYTNRDSLSIGTVFHLDSVTANGRPPHELLDSMLEHRLLRNWLGGYYDEAEYSAKLIPDGKKALLKIPYRDNMLAVGDAAGQMQAAGPIIKGMNHGITAGVLAAQAYIEAKKEGKPQLAGPTYAKWLKSTPMVKELKKYRSVGAKITALQATFGAPFLPMLIKIKPVAKMVEGLMGNYNKALTAPDTRFTYVTLPTLLAKNYGTPVENAPPLKLRSLDDRIGALKYDTDIGKAHIEMLDDSIAVNGRCVTACPVSSPDSSRGCYRIEKGGGKEFVVLDTQPCVECGTCAVVGKTRWEHPSGGKGVGYEWG